MSNKFLQGIWKPLALEYDIQDINVIGTIPIELNGTFYRNGPNPQYVFSDKYHMYEGDGMLHAITFQNGQVRYQNRWIRTDKFLAEQQAKKSLFGGMRDGMICDVSVQNCSRNTANTNVIWHHGKLLALNEGSGPLLIDCDDLTKCSTYTFNQKLNCSMMAHPKIDPLSGEMIFYSFLGPDFRYFIADNKGKITHQEKITMPFLSMMHDFAFTEHFSIFPLFPLVLDFQRIMRGEQPFKWEPNLNTRFAIMPRYGNDNDIVWFEDIAAMGFHTVNAREERDKIILEMVVIDDIPSDVVPFSDDDVFYKSYLTRWIFDLKKRRVTKHRLDDVNVEFPRIDERFSGRNQCHAYMNGTINQNLSHVFDSIIHYDVRNKKKRIHHFGNGSYPMEPIFVPRSLNAGEGNGFILSYVFHEKLDRSDLVILDAQHVDDKPLAIVQLPHRVPFGFHGCWKSYCRS